jgi:hypothetical protein
MSKKQKKAKKTKLPKLNLQIPISQIRSAKISIVPEALQYAREYPYHGCWIYADWKESGIAPVVVARQQSDGKLVYGVYMIDLYCLGIKDAYTRTDISKNKFERDLPKMCAQEPQECTVEFAHELIYDAMEYAARYGFEPYVDFMKQSADQLLDPPDAHPRTHQIEFGQDGKPFYVAGPYDSEFKIKSVISTLERTAREGNFNCLVGLGPPGSFDEET